LKETIMALPQAYRELAREHPQVIKSYEALGDAVRAAGPLDGKSIALVKLAIALAAELEGGTHSAVRKALDAGCSREELLHVVLLSTTTLGFPAMMRARSWVLDVLEGSKK
jgi:alkylhydroperoxidase/carboxymuconolactone decarboxylase family protein YurZ